MPIMWDTPVWGADPVGESPFAVAPLKLAQPRTSTQAEGRSSSPFHHHQQTSLDDQNNNFYLGAGAPQGLGINGLAAHPPYRHQTQYSSVTKPPTPEERYVAPFYCLSASQSDAVDWLASYMMPRPVYHCMEMIWKRESHNIFGGTSD